MKVEGTPGCGFITDQQHTGTSHLHCKICKEELRRKAG
jgi:hypothetical protein